MFTGLIEEEGQIRKVLSLGQNRRIWVRANLNAGIGDSISVDGVCLTVEAIERGLLVFFLAKETLDRTKFKTFLKSGQYVNLERAMHAESFLGGHIVQGHVDVQGKVKSIKKQGDSYMFTFSFPNQFGKFLVEKGSIAIDGISLTIATIKGGKFSVQIIPHTYGLTTTKRMYAGYPVNLEFDVLGKYVVKTVESYLKKGNIPF